MRAEQNDFAHMPEGNFVQKLWQVHSRIALSTRVLHRLLRSPHLAKLGGVFPQGSWRLVEEPRQSLQVLGSCGKEELLCHELESPQV